MHLPKKYCSAYIIDGQHRLYGYSGSEYATKNTIPVVAFENLEKEEQIRLFMDINENQKAVPKNLRNTLSADLLWASEIYTERRKALRLRLAEALGEEQESPLFGHVLIGENKKTTYRCITMDGIEKGLNAGKLISTFNKSNSLMEIGLLDNELPSNEFAFDKIRAFLYAAFDYLKSKLPEEWEQGEGNAGILTNNSGINALLRIFSDILCFLEKQQLIASVKNENVLTLIEKAQPLFDAVVKFYKTIDPQLRSEIKTQYGGNGPVQHWRYLQKAIHESVKEFDPEGFEAWWADNSKQYNEEAERKLETIEKIVITAVRNFMGENDLELPYNMRLDFNMRLFKENESRKQDGGPLADEWDLFTLLDCQRLATEPGSLWMDGLRELYTRPEQEGRKGGNKIQKIAWLSDMYSIQQGLKKSSYSVKQAQFEYIRSIEDWLRNAHPECVGELEDLDSRAD